MKKSKITTIRFWTWNYATTRKKPKGIGPEWAICNENGLFSIDFYKQYHVSIDILLKPKFGMNFSHIICQVCS